MCSDLIKPDTHLGENTRQIVVSDAPGVRIVVAFADFPGRSYRGPIPHNALSGLERRTIFGAVAALNTLTCRLFGITLHLSVLSFNAADQPTL